jgi:hypothetical protein
LAKLPDSNDPAEIERHLNIAYRTVMRDVVLPKLSAKSETSVLENLQRKAAASTSVNPGSAAASTPRKVTRFSDLPPEAWR